MEKKKSPTEMTKIYKELAKYDVRCAKCCHCSVFSADEWLADCALDGSRIFTDDHACYQFKARD